MEREIFDLNVDATVQELMIQKFQEIANGTKSGCPVSREH